MLKHVRWDLWLPAEKKNLRGQVAVKMVCDRLELKVLSGPALPAELLFPVLSAAMPEGWLTEAEDLHRSRAKPWVVTTRTGMSGCMDYTLRSLRDIEFLDQPRSASLHVSMESKLNGGMRHLWLGDLPPILAAVLQDFPPATKDISIQVYEPVLRDGYCEAGDASGLRAILDGLAAMEVMAK